MEYKSRLCSNVGMHQCKLNYWETFAPVVNWISVRMILATASIHELTSISNDFVLDFTQAYIDVDIFTELTYVMVVDGNS